MSLTYVKPLKTEAMVSTRRLARYGNRGQTGLTRFSIPARASTQIGFDAILNTIDRAV